MYNFINIKFDLWVMKPIFIIDTLQKLLQLNSAARDVVRTTGLKGIRDEEY